MANTNNADILRRINFLVRCCKHQNRTDDQILNQGCRQFGYHREDLIKTAIERGGI